MRRYVLFLLKPGFYDDKGGPFFCPNCAAVEGFLKYAPEVESQPFDSPACPSTLLGMARGMVSLPNQRLGLAQG
jgi:hypothetical protein